MSTKIVLVGDSNTEYSDSTYGDMAAKLSAALHAAYPAMIYVVTNSGVGGSTSKNALDNFSSQVTFYTPDLVVFLHGGTNDGYYTYKSLYPTIYNDDAYEARLRSYKALVDALPTHPLMMLIPAPAHAEASDGFTYHRNFTDTNPLRIRMESLATEWGVPVVNWYTQMVANGNWKNDYLVDGVHVNGAAKDALVTGIMAALGPYLSVDGSITVPAVDITSPTITGFVLPSTSASLIVPVTAFTATDNVAAVGYLITESTTSPLSNDSDWVSSAPASFTFGSDGSRTAYAWVKDAAGNVSAGVSAEVVITLASDPPPAAESVVQIRQAGLWEGYTMMVRVGGEFVEIREVKTKNASGAWV